MAFNVHDWYWLADDGRLYSSATQSLVTPSSSAYTAWTAHGNVATRWPVDDANAQTTVSLQDVLTPYGLFGDLLSYANSRQWQIATGGKTLTVGTKTITFDTSSEGQALLTGKFVRLSQPNPPASVSWQVGPQNFVDIAAADFLAAAISVADFVQATFDKLRMVEAAITASPPTITTQAQVDAAFATLS